MAEQAKTPALESGTNEESDVYASEIATIALAHAGSKVEFARLTSALQSLTGRVVTVLDGNQKLIMAMMMRMIVQLVCCVISVVARHNLIVEKGGLDVVIAMLTSAREANERGVTLAQQFGIDDADEVKVH